VVSDFNATQGSSELSVQKGQQVEVIDANCIGAPDFCLVRLICNVSNNNVSSSSLSSSSIKDTSSQEGLVPTSILKPAPLQAKNKRHGEATDEGNKLHFFFFVYKFRLLMLLIHFQIIKNKRIIELYQLVINKRDFEGKKKNSN
jgi:hypothetical protein